MGTVQLWGRPPTSASRLGYYVREAIGVLGSFEDGGRASRFGMMAWNANGLTVLVQIVYDGGSDTYRSHYIHDRSPVRGVP